MCLPIKPFKIEAEFEHAGLKCAVTQNQEGRNRCGYVRVPPGHPLHGKDFMDVDVEVHGSLSFSETEPCSHDDGQGWWFGFDCGHTFDARYDPDLNLEDCTTDLGRAMFEIAHKYPEVTYIHEHFWTREEVEMETRQLAEQLAMAV